MIRANYELEKKEFIETKNLEIEIEYIYFYKDKIPLPSGWIEVKADSLVEIFEDVIRNSSFTKVYMLDTGYLLNLLWHYLEIEYEDLGFDKVSFGPYYLDAYEPITLSLHIDYLPYTIEKSFLRKYFVTKPHEFAEEIIEPETREIFRAHLDELYNMAKEIIRRINKCIKEEAEPALWKWVSDKQKILNKLLKKYKG